MGYSGVTLETFNKMSDEEARKSLEMCCGAKRWISRMAEKRPFKSPAEVYLNAEQIWFGLSETDWLQAFAHHPKIGDIDSLRTKFASTAALAGAEQSGALSATEAVLRDLKTKNEAYEKKFGFIFIVCATGKTAAQMLSVLNGRLEGQRPTELHQAAVEQAKITKLRLEKLLR